MNRRFFTLLELTIVLFVLAALAAVVTPLVSQSIASSRSRATALSMLTIREAIMGTNGTAGYWQEMETYPWPGANDLADREDYPQLHFLFVAPAPEPDYDPATGLGWHGSYLQHASGRYVIDNANNFTDNYGEDDDLAILDAWGHPIVIQLWEGGGDAESESDYARLVSAGPDGRLDTDAFQQAASDLDDTIDDLVLYLKQPGSLNLDEPLSTSK